MKKHSRKAGFAKKIVFGLIAVTVFTFALMLLWNWLMPVIFGLTVITFWQALGLLALSKILFGGFHKPMMRKKDKSHKHKEQFMKRFGKKTSCKEEHKKDKKERKDEKK